MGDAERDEARQERIENEIIVVVLTNVNREMFVLNLRILIEFQCDL